MKAADRRRLRRRRRSSSTATSRTRSGSIRRRRCARSIHDADPVGAPGLVARRLRRADHRHRRTWSWAADLQQVVGTMRNFIPERMVRATGQMMRMNIDDGDIFIGEFANGAIGSIQTSFVTVGNYPGHRGAHLRQRRARSSAGWSRSNGICESIKVGDAPTRSSSASSSAGAVLSAGRQPARVVALALLRQSGRAASSTRSSATVPGNEGNFEDGAWVQETDQRRRAVVPRAALGLAAARHDARTRRSIDSSRITTRAGR